MTQPKTGDAPARRDHVEREPVGLGAADGFDHDARTVAAGERGNLPGGIRGARVDGRRRAHAKRQRTLGLADVERDDPGAPPGGASHGARADATAPDHEHRVVAGDARASYGVHPDGERLYEREMFQREHRRRIETARADNGSFSQRAVALHAKRLVVAAGVWPMGAARGTGSAVLVGTHRYPGARRPAGHTRAKGFDHAGDLVADDSRV